MVIRHYANAPSPNLWVPAFGAQEEERRQDTNFHIKLRLLLDLRIGDIQAASLYRKVNHFAKLVCPQVPH
jgi:hypothetical protein